MIFGPRGCSLIAGAPRSVAARRPVRASWILGAGRCSPGPRGRPISTKLCLRPGTRRNSTRDLRARGMKHSSEADPVLGSARFTRPREARRVTPGPKPRLNGAKLGRRPSWPSVSPGPFKIRRSRPKRPELGVSATKARDHPPRTSFCKGSNKSPSNSLAWVMLE